MDGYRIARFLDTQAGPLTVRGWAILGIVAGYYVAGLRGASAPLREADRLAQRARTWRGMAEEIAEAITEPLADRLAGALARRGMFVIGQAEDTRGG